MGALSYDIVNLLFGNGADGSADLDGTNTYSDWTSKSGSVYTMTLSKAFM